MWKIIRTLLLCYNQIQKIMINLNYFVNKAEGKRKILNTIFLPFFFSDWIPHIFFPRRKSHEISLENLLIQPIQRIPRYQLLLKVLLKNTWESHEDFETLGLALAKIEEVKFFPRKKKCEEKIWTKNTADFCGKLLIWFLVDLSFYWWYAREIYNHSKNVPNRKYFGN